MYSTDYVILERIYFFRYFINIISYITNTKGIDFS